LLAIDFAAVADFEDEDDEFAELDPDDDPDIANTIAPRARVLTLESGAEVARVVRASYALVEETNDAGAVTASEGAQVL
jgi:hypothetical protein